MVGSAVRGDLPAAAWSGARCYRRTSWTFTGTKIAFRASSSGTCRFGVFPVGLRSRGHPHHRRTSARRPGSSLAKAIGTRIQSVETFEYPHSIGFLWEVFSGYLGFSHSDASKVMGLAAYGNPEVFRQQFLSILRTDEVNYGVAQEFLGVHPDRFARMEAMFGPPRDADSEILPRHADMAAALQAATDAAVTALVRRVKRRVPFENLCLAGGVALNCVTNELVRRSGEFSNVFIPSAPHDAGTAIGAAFAVHCAKQKRPPQRGNFTPYLGPAFKRRDILAAVKSAGLDGATKQVARARRRGHDRRWQDRRLVSGSHGVRAPCAG